MNRRESTLNRIRSGLYSIPRDLGRPLFGGEDGDTEAPAPEPTRPSSEQEELVRLFTREAEALSCRVMRAIYPEEVGATLKSIIRETGSRKIIRWHNDFLPQLVLDSVFEMHGVQDLTGRPGSRDDLPRMNAAIAAVRDADLGITGADYALADTGTLVLTGSAGRGRSVSLLPPVHVAVLPINRILPGLDELILTLQSDFDENGRLDTAFTLITGPSKTADIEMNLVHGVHGPGAVYIILTDIEIG